MMSQWTECNCVCLGAQCREWLVHLPPFPITTIRVNTHLQPTPPLHSLCSAHSLYPPLSLSLSNPLVSTHNLLFHLRFSLFYSHYPISNYNDHFLPRLLFMLNFLHLLIIYFLVQQFMI